MTETPKRKQLTRQERLIQEAAWFEQGRLACLNGALFEDWPRPVVKYTSEWYRTKTEWQRGYESVGFSGTNQGHYGSYDPPAIPQDAMRERVIRLTQSPIERTYLLRHFNGSDRLRVLQIVTELVTQGVLKQTGRGRRGSPYVIQKA